MGCTSPTIINLQKQQLHIAPKHVSCTECTGQWNDFQLIPTVKLETRHPVEGSHGSEFTKFCNHCRVTAAGSLKNAIK